MKVVMDCNVLIAAGITNGTCRKVVDHVIRNHQWCTSEPARQEFLEVIQRPHLQKYRHRLNVIAQAMSESATFVEPDSGPITLPDTDDVVYLQTAVASEANFFITGNRRHFPFPQYGGILILTPGEFLREISEST